MTVMRLSGILLASMLVASGVTAALAQQQPVSALKGHDSKAPIDRSAFGRGSITSGPSGPAAIIRSPAKPRRRSRIGHRRKQHR